MKFFTLNFCLNQKFNVQSLNKNKTRLSKKVSVFCFYLISPLDYSAAQVLHKPSCLQIASLLMLGNWASNIALEGEGRLLTGGSALTLVSLEEASN